MINLFNWSKAALFSSNWEALMLKGVIITVIAVCFIGAPGHTVHFLTWLFGVIVLIGGILALIGSGRIAGQALRDWCGNGCRRSIYDDCAGCGQFSPGGDTGIFYFIVRSESNYDCPAFADALGSHVAVGHTGGDCGAFHAVSAGGGVGDIWSNYRNISSGVRDFQHLHGLRPAAKNHVINGS